MPGVQQLSAAPTKAVSTAPALRSTETKSPSVLPLPCVHPQPHSQNQGGQPRVPADTCAPWRLICAGPFPVLRGARAEWPAASSVGVCPASCRSGSVSVLDSLSPFFRSSWSPVLRLRTGQTLFSLTLFFYPRDARGAIQRRCVCTEGPPGRAQCRRERLRARRHRSPRRCRCPSRLSLTKGSVSSFSMSDSGSSGNEQRDSERVSP